MYNLYTVYRLPLNTTECVFRIVIQRKFSIFLQVGKKRQTSSKFSVFTVYHTTAIQSKPSVWGPLGEIPSSTPNNS